jgi:broad specificity phosphatase PhoE
MPGLLLVRHGESTWNATGRWQGWADPPLSDLGRAQARSAAARADGFGTVVSSDLQRARETADLIAGSLGLGVMLDAGLRERHVGQLTGLTRAEIEARWPDLFDGRGSLPPEPPGGETTEELLHRVLAALRRVARSANGADVLVVTHGGVIRNLERHLGEVPEPCPNLGGVRIDVEDGRLSSGGRVLLIDPDDVEVTVPRQP